MLVRAGQKKTLRTHVSRKALMNRAIPIDQTAVRILKEFRGDYSYESLRLALWRVFRLVWSLRQLVLMIKHVMQLSIYTIALSR